LGKNVAVFVDVANIFYAAKAAGVDIDYVTMLKSATAGRDLVRAYAYTGLDPDNENQRNFHDFLRRHGYKVVSKDIRKYGDGKVKANLDIELVVDMMKTARNLDVAIVVSGDGDFAPAIRAVQEMGVRCEVISFRGNTSSDLIEVADLFTDITQIAKVEKGSSRSGRRVADDDEDLSMTEVPDKQTEGTGAGRGRGRGTGRGRGRTGEAEPVAAGGRVRRRVTEAEPVAASGRSRAGARPAEGVREVVPTVGGGALVALPGEKLSRAAAGGAVAPVGLVASEVGAEDEAEGSLEAEAAGAGIEVMRENEEPGDGEARRRRRRRGGRGRGRGRGVEDGASESGVRTEGRAPAPAGGSRGPDVDDIPAAPRAPRAAAFGSVWDSQIGVPRTPSPLASLPADDEFDDEPAIPEYLIAERRGNRGSGVRTGGGRGGYAAAVDRERYGRGSSGGINRYPDVSARTGSAPSGGSGGRGPRDGGRDGGRRDDRGYGRGGDRPLRSDRPVGGAPRSGEQWSEVPPELEAMLRAQLAAKNAGSAPRDQGPPERPVSRSGSAVGSPAPAPAPTAETSAPATAAPRRGRGRPAAGGTAVTTAGTPATSGSEAVPAARLRPTRARATTPAADAPAANAEAAAKAAAPKPRAARAKATTEAAPKPRATRAKAAPAAPASGAASASGAAPAAPRRRATKAAPSSSTEA
jgi:uncharacterized LabA/DUF88 family protein